MIPLKRKPAKAAQYAVIADAMMHWYSGHQRSLPFRDTTDPYHILVSEIMLQQTQVATVVPYYLRFIDRFPSVSLLAEADEQEVLSQWAGLGYYRRARNLQAAARQICSQHAGVFPRDLHAIRALPGIGRYTAGAVASFAFNQPVPIVEANSARVLARLFGIRENIKSSTAQKKLWQYASRLVPPDSARTLNYSIMELGALVCAPSNPRCGVCPVSGNCVAFKRNLQNVIPVLPEKPRKVMKSYSSLVLGCEGHFLVRRIPEGEWHAGLYEFPKLELAPDASTDAPAATAKKLLKNLIMRSAGLRTVATIKYTVTHHEITLHVFHAEVAGKAANIPDEHSWVHVEKLTNLPMGSPQKRIVKLLQRQCDLVGLLE